MGQRGFSIIEVLVVTALTLTIASAAFALMGRAQANVDLESEAADMQQRSRVAAGALYSDLVMAGAGMSRGPNKGSLAYYFAPVLPYRRGANADDPPGSYTTQTITLMYVPAGAAQTSLATEGPQGITGDIGVNQLPGCPVGDDLCGFRKGMNVVLFDGTGQFDPFIVTDEGTGMLQVRLTGRALTSASYPPDMTSIAALANVVYSLKSDEGTGTYQLVTRAGDGRADVPVVDHVVALVFDYFGDPRPPVLAATPLSGAAGPWTTYGPSPPPRGEQIPSGGYPAGENCLFAIDHSSGMHVPRLADLAVGGPPQALARLGPELLTDGPWCPDPTNVNRWDADLLRIRKISVTLRIQAANAALRGPASLLFAHGGTSTNASRWLPDRQVRFEVSPRNLGG